MSTRIPLTLLTLIAGAGLGLAQDTFLTAVPLDPCGGETATFDNTAATTEPELPTCGSGEDVWYRITPTHDGSLTVTNVANANGIPFDGFLAAYRLGLENVLANPGLESGAPGPGASGWITFGNVFTEAANPPVFDPCEGSQIVSMFGNFTGEFNVSGMLQAFPTRAGSEWQMSTNTRHFSGDPMVGTGPGDDNWVVQKLAFFDDLFAGTEIGSAESIILDGTFATDVCHPSARITAVAPPGTMRVEALILYLQPAFAGGAAHIDDVRVLERRRALMCNDSTPGSDAVTILVDAGDTYMFRAGGSTPGETTTAGQLITSTLPPANDDCANAEPIFGCGDFEFSNLCATTDGPTSALCDKFGTDQVSNDVWYSWVAPETASYVLSTCDGTTLDTKIAVLDETGATTLACNDDTCGLQSEVTFAALQGTTYKMRIGTFSAAAFGSGTFSLTPGGGQSTYCTSNGAISMGGTQSILANDSVISVTGVDASPGLFFMGQNAGMLSGPSCTVTGAMQCIGSPFFRFPPSISTGGMNSRVLDFDGPGNESIILSGQTWNFQFWYRGAGTGGVECNFSDALCVTFVD